MCDPQLMKVYLSGNYVDAQEATVSIWDAGFLFGEGVFSTLRLYQGVAPDLASHWQRLTRQAEELAIALPATLDELRAIVDQLVKINRLELGSSRLRITVTRGADPLQPLPISLTHDRQPTLLLTLAPLPEGFDDQWAEGIRVITLGPEFARHCRPDIKSLSYLPSILALRQAQQRSCSESLMFTSKGFLTEAAMSNVFVCKSSVVFTPKNNGDILAGCTRQRVLNLAKRNKLVFREDNISLDDLKSSDEVFLCNSIREIVPVISIDDQPIGQGVPGSITKNLRQWYREDFAAGN